MAAVAMTMKEVAECSGTTEQESCSKQRKPCAWGRTTVAGLPAKSVGKWPSLSESVAKVVGKKQHCHSIGDESETTAGSSASSDGHSDDESTCRASTAPEAPDAAHSSDRFGERGGETKWTKLEDLVDEGAAGNEPWDGDIGGDEFLFGPPPPCESSWAGGPASRREPQPQESWEAEEPKKLRTEAPVFVPSFCHLATPPLGTPAAPPGLRTPLRKKAATFIPSSGPAPPPGLERIGEQQPASEASSEAKAPTCAAVGEASSESEP